MGVLACNFYWKKLRILNNELMACMVKYKSTLNRQGRVFKK